MANATGRKLALHDIDAPLEVSLARPGNAEASTASRRITERLIQEQTAGRHPARALTARKLAELADLVTRVSPW